MKNEKLSTDLLLELSGLLNKALLVRPRQEKSALLLAYGQQKIFQMIHGLFNKRTSYNYFDQRLFSAQYTEGNLSFSEIAENTLLTAESALKISNLFLEALNNELCDKSAIDKLMADKQLIQTQVNDLFEMSPAFNLFEYRQFVNRASLENFREVQTFDGATFIVCVSDEVCVPWGHKSGEHINSLSATRGDETIIGVAPFLGETRLALWVANDSIQYRSPGNCVVGAYTTPGFI